MTAEYDVSQADEGSYVRFEDCGCEIWTQQDGEQFVMRPCKPGCEKYQYALAQSRAKGNPIRYKME